MARICENFTKNVFLIRTNGVFSAAYAQFSVSTAYHAPRMADSMQPFPFSCIKIAPRLRQTKQGASIELSADAPVREPYIAYFQGGLTYEHCRYALEKILEKIVRE